ncbi:MAG: VOC family protein, partial [Balneolaceae bacterium]
PAKDMDATKAFFSTVFGWRFVDYGPDYIAVQDAGLDAGFYRSELTARTDDGSALVILYSSDLGKTADDVEKGGGSIIKPTFSFPGGRRFHFSDPNGNEFAVWSDIGI